MSEYRAADPDPHGSAFNFPPGSRRETFKKKKQKKCMEMVILLKLKNQTQLKMEAESQLSVLIENSS